MKRFFTLALAVILFVPAFADKSSILPGKGRTCGITLGAVGKTTTVRTADIKNMVAFMPSNLGFTPAAKVGLTINPTFGLGLGLRTGIFAEYSRSTYKDNEATTWQNILLNTELATIVPGTWLPESNMTTIYRDISVQVPLQLSFRVMPLPKFGVVFYAGPTVEAGAWQAKFTKNGDVTTVSENLYKDNYQTKQGVYDAINVLLGAGFGLEMGHFRLDVATDWGVRKVANAEYWNKPLSVNLTYFF